MRRILNLITILIFFFTIPFSFSQEWKNLKDYKKQTGQTVLTNGNWLKKDRCKNSEIWQKANRFNLTTEKGNLKYKTISQIRDFYIWFDYERKKLGHEINAFGVTAIVAGQLSNFDNYFIRTFIVRNKEVIWFGNQGSKDVLAFAFPLIKEIYFSKNLLKGEKAKEWDIKNGKIEQCQIVESIYQQLSPKAILKLERMAKGKGIYNLGVKNELKFDGNIKDCKDRYKHAFTKLYQFYKNKK